MYIRNWEDLPECLRVPEVKYYYDSLNKKVISLLWKRIFDVVASILMLIVLSPIILMISLAIRLDSRGPVFYRQVRITQYAREFRIFKFRTMITDADKGGTLITVNNDNRITRVGKVLRKTKLDEVPQLFNILSGDMSYVGTRPEVRKYVEQYSPEMMVTLLLPAGITSLASIYYKDENSLIDNADDVDKVYLEQILPDKMKWNLQGVYNYSFLGDIKLMFMTFFAAFGKEYKSGE